MLQGIVPVAVGHQARVADSVPGDVRRSSREHGKLPLGRPSRAGVGQGVLPGGRRLQREALVTTDLAVLPRRADRTHGVTRLGADQQVDDKALVFAPTDVALTDPFLVLAEDWFSSPGFDWHPHRG